MEESKKNKKCNCSTLEKQLDTASLEKNKWEECARHYAEKFQIAYKGFLMTPARSVGGHRLGAGAVHESRARRVADRLPRAHPLGEPAVRFLSGAIGLAGAALCHAIGCRLRRHERSIPWPDWLAAETAAFLRSAKG